MSSSNTTFRQAPKITFARMRFHTFQTMRATLNQFESLRSDPLRHLTLVGLVRMFAAQRMQRNVLMSTRFALKLSKGEYLADDDERAE